MFYVGIDVAKNKHDCIILNENGEVLVKHFTFLNDADGFEILLHKIMSVSEDFSQFKIGLEATGHYSYNLLGFLLEQNLPTYVLNPLLIFRYKNSQTLRKTKTDKLDSHTIATFMRLAGDLKPYTTTDYHNENLKSLTRLRFKQVAERGKLKTAISRLVTILFPELEKLVCEIHRKSIYAMLLTYPGAHYLAKANLTKLTNILWENSQGHFGREDAIRFREAARNTIARGHEVVESDSIELKMTIHLIRVYDKNIAELDEKIEAIVTIEVNPAIRTIPCMGGTIGALVIAEIGDINRFDDVDKLLAYTGMSPSIYQSGQKENCHPHMEKRGSRYLRYAMYNLTQRVCQHDDYFNAYLSKKIAEGKHYNVALSHAAKKLVRLIYAIYKSGQPYVARA